jgi:hypothetical protein
VACLEVIHFQPFLIGVRPMQLAWSNSGGSCGSIA